MRISLRSRLTTALVAFGLVPASIVAYFAYQGYGDYKEKQKLLIRLAADAFSQEVASVLQPHLETQAKEKSAAGPGSGHLTEDDKTQLRNMVTNVVDNYNLRTAKVIVVDPNNNVFLKRNENSGIEILEIGVRLEEQYSDAISG